MGEDETAAEVRHGTGTGSIEVAHGSGPLEVTRGVASPEDVAALVALLGSRRAAAEAVAGEEPAGGYAAWRRTRLAALRRDRDVSARD